MAYSEQVLHRARARLEQAKAEREQENAAHRADAYARYPRLAEIDNELRRTMAELMAAALQRGEDSSQAVAAVREKNLALQRERSWILEAGDFDDGYLDDTPVCAKCGGRGYVGAQMCSCLRELCRQEQKKELTSLLGSGRETFENFRLDLYPAEYSESVRTSPRALMQRNFNHCRKYAQNFTMQSGNMLFSGATGLGRRSCPPASRARWPTGATASYTIRPFTCFPILKRKNLACHRRKTAGFPSATCSATCSSSTTLARK